MTQELPPGWITASLSSVTASLRDGTHTPPKRVPQGIPLLSARNIQDGHVDLAESYSFISRVDFDAISRTNPITNEDVLLTIVGSIGRSCVNRNPMPFAVQRSVAIVRPDLGILNSDFLSFFFRSPETQTALQELASGTAQKGVYLGTIKSMSIPLPPLAEQKRIVAKLEVLLAKVDAGRKRLEKIPVILKRFRQSVLAAACSGRLTADWREEHPDIEPASCLLGQIKEAIVSQMSRKARSVVLNGAAEVTLEVPDKWAVCFFDELVAAKPNAIKAGPFGSSLTKANYVPTGFKVYGQEQVISGDPFFGDYYISKEKFAELQSCEVSAGDILISLVGTIGKVLIIPQEFERGIINPRLAKISLHPSVARQYITDYLFSPVARDMLSSQSHGGTMEILNLGILRALPIPLPPLPEQHEIVRRVEALFALADQIETRYVKAKTQVDRLTQSILAKAFRGDLVPQDPKDEPAEVLLERIRSQRTSKISPKKRGG